ncbi:MAG TPA: MarR family transcriptional regulator, partial [Acidimicrobiales bacterium]|nr:MarR family transcriptional regulator [Acidimicrobiales bacterium]
MTATEAGLAGEDVQAVASALRVALMRLARRLRTETTGSSLTASQVSALATLDRHGPMTPTELAEREAVQKPSITKVIASLTDLGLVSRRPDPADGRQVIVAITDRGAGMLQADRSNAEAWLARRLAALPESDRVALMSAVGAVQRLAGGPDSGGPGA